MSTIEGQIVDTDTVINRPNAGEMQALPDQHQQVANYNPLASDPRQFKQELVSRQENYDALAMHLRGMLVPDKDFGRIHVKKGCPDKYRCVDPYHFSGYQLFAAGADKVLGMLSLGVQYPNEQDFIRAALKGNQIHDVIMSCNILNHAAAIISQGMGACSRDEGQMKGDLNNTIKRACKRARVDAVLRLPAISALFEDDFLAQVAAEANRTGGNSTTARAQQVNQKWNTGAKLIEWPKGGKLAGQKFVDMEDSALDWICQKCQNDPDIFNAAKAEVDRRAASHTPPQSTADGPAKDSAREGRNGSDSGPPPTGAVTNEYDDYPEAQ